MDNTNNCVDQNEEGDIQCDQQKFIDTVQTHLSEIDRLKSERLSQSPPNIKVEQVEDKAANALENKDDSDKAIRNRNRARRIAAHMVLPDDSMNSMPNDNTPSADSGQPQENTQLTSSILSLMESGIEIPLTIRNFILTSLDNVLQKIKDYSEPISEPIYKIIVKNKGEVKVMKKEQDKEEEEEEVLVCTEKTEISFWEKVQSLVKGSNPNPLPEVETSDKKKSRV